MSSYAFTLPFSCINVEMNIILGKRQLIQKKEAGKTIPGIIPEWAGQWGLIGGPANTGEDGQTAAARTFKEQTGIDVSDADVQFNFMLENQSLSPLQTENYNPFNVLCIFTSQGALELLQSVIQDTLETDQVRDYTLRETQLVDVPKARTLLGPTPPPPDGWQKYLIANYFGGTQPGMLNTNQDILTAQITNSAAQDNSYFTTALSDKDTSASAK